MSFFRIGIAALAFAVVGATLLGPRRSLAQNAPAAGAKDEDDDDMGAPTPKKHKAATQAPSDDDDQTKSGPKLDQATMDQAKATLIKYLNNVKAKKWKEARQEIHPLTLKLIEQVKKRLGEERHSMAPWYWAKESFYMTNYKITDMTSAAHGTVVAQTLEDSYQVEEKGDLQGEKAVYLLGKQGGHWYVVDKKNEADGFTPDSLKYGYPKYFDEP
jgi:hypothetical protein